MSVRDIIMAAAGAGSAVTNDPYFSNVSLLLHMDGTNGSTTITDSGPLSLAITASGATLSTAQKKFGTASLSVDSSKWAYAPDNAGFAFGSGNFTIEAWIYPTSDATGRIISQQDSNALAPFWFVRRSAGTGGYITFEGYNGLTIVSGGVAPLNTWTHVACVRNGSTASVYINGSATGGSGSYSGNLGDSYRPVSIGCLYNGSASEFFSGYIDEVRVTKGVARYTSNFTVPSGPYPNA